MATIHLSFPPRVPGLEKDLEMELCRWYPPLVADYPSLLLHRTIFFHLCFRWLHCNFACLIIQNDTTRVLLNKCPQNIPKMQ